MKKLVSLFAGAGLLAMGCAGGAEGEYIGAQEESISAPPASLTYTTNNATNYCATITMPNALGTSASRWVAVLDVKTNNITSVSGATKSASTGVVTFKPSSTASIPAGGNATFSFCATASSSSVRPVIKAWNLETSAYGTCNTQSGLMPTKAALAVAMAKELGRWDPADLAVQGQFGYPNSRVVLNSASAGRCVNGCANTKGILAQQDASFVDQNLFNATNFKNDLEASFQRQANMISDLKRNNPGALPPAHKLTLVGGPSDLGVGACGPHYIFQVDDQYGNPLSAAQANNMANALCFYGYGSCGNNPYLSFQTTTVGCPAGRTCVAIDPQDGDTGSDSTTSAGSAPTYPMDRVWNPDNSLLGTACISSMGLLKSLQSKCSTKPTTCGYLYCI